MKKFLNKYKNQIIDFLILIDTIVFTLLIEGKFADYLEFVKVHPMKSIAFMGVISFILGIIKIIFELKQINLEEQLDEVNIENEFLKDLISAFKYQISQPLEDKLYEVFKNLKLNHQHRITVYTYTKGTFISIARYSENATYKSFGRISINDKSELLFKAWETKELNEIVAPDPKRKMPSKKIVIKYLYEKNDTSPKKDKIGVIVFETINDKDSKFNNGKLNTAVDSINEFMNESWNVKQDLNFAIREGV